MRGYKVSDPISIQTCITGQIESTIQINAKYALKSSFYPDIKLMTISKHSGLKFAHFA